MRKEFDVVVVGNGAAGLFAALQFPADKEIAVITKGDMEESDSFLAQGGICVLKNEEDYASYFEDTMRAGHYENDKKAVEIMIRSSQDIIRELIDDGVNFEMDHGGFCFTREAAHSAPRILHHEDLTGKEITSKLLSCAMERPNIHIYTHTTMVDILEKDQVCYGVMAEDASHRVRRIVCDYTIWACGGIGGLYKHSTNFRQLTGDALAISMRHHIALENIDYVQIHPTTLYSEKPGRRFLISESVRGEGAVLLDQNGERFVDELLPRDCLTEKIREKMQEEGTDYVRLSLEKMDADEIPKRFPNIYKTCMEEGVDITREPVPVTPAQHYFMGGVKVDSEGRTSMQRLYAAGETACNGVHGANRLASNSLLESLVWAKRAVRDIVANYDSVSRDWCENYFVRPDGAGYLPDLTYAEIEQEYHDMVRRGIEEARAKRAAKND